jgi:hypothetical protein
MFKIFRKKSAPAPYKLTASKPVLLFSRNGIIVKSNIRFGQKEYIIQGEGYRFTVASLPQLTEENIREEIRCYAAEKADAENDHSIF